MARLKIGETFLANGIISNDQLNSALQIQRKEGGLLGLILVKKNFITPDQLSFFIEMTDKFEA